MTNIVLGGFVRDNAGGALTDPTVELFDRNDTATVLDTASLSSTGYWSFDRSPDNDNTDRYDVRVTNGSEQRFLSYDDQVQLTTIDVANFRLRNPADTYVYDIVPAAITGDRTLNLPETTQTTTVVSTPVEDNVLLSLGAGGDAVMLNRSTALSADTELSNVIVGTSDHPGVAANSLIISNITTDGDIMFAVSDGGNSKGLLLIDGSEGLIVPHGSIVPSATNTIDLGTSSLEFKDAFFDGTVTADAFAGPLTGNVTGNASGTAATVTGGTQASITTVANVVEVGALDAGSITSGFGNIDVGGSSIAAGSFDASDGNITNVGDIALDTISADGSTITITGNTTFADGAYDFNIASHDGTNGLALAGTVVTTTAAELNLIDGGTARGTTAIADGDGVLINDGGTMRMTTVETLATYMESEINAFSLATTFSNTLTVGVDETGYDVQFFGATAGASFLWDASEDRLILDQGTDDSFILELRSTDDVEHGMTARASTNTYAYMKKQSITGGGLVISALTESTNGVTIQSAATTANTTKTRGGTVAILMDCQFRDGTGVQTYAAGAAEGNLWGVADQAAGLVLMVNEDGNVYSPTTNAHVAFTDSYDDAQLVRTLDHVKTAAGDAGMIRDKWDEFIKYNEQDLIDAEVLGAPVSEGGMTNVTQLQRLHNGAIWQGYVRQQEMQERIEVMETKLLALQEAN